MWGGVPMSGEENGLPIEPRVVRSARRSFALELKPEGLIVRVPNWATQGQIREFVARHQRWIEKAAARQAQRLNALGDVAPLTGEELRALADQARAYIPQRVAHYAPLVGVTYGSITIRTQRTRWGSCSAKGNLSFNCLLMLAPAQVIDSVVAHELCHRKEMNHSQRFYDQLLRVFPDYRACRGWLREHGEALLRRVPS